MSSIVSDIFYDSKNNALLDDYFLNKNETDSEITPQQELSKLQNSHISQSCQSSETKYGFSFKITITQANQNDKATEKNALINRKQEITKGTLFKLRVKMGTMVFQELIQSRIPNLLQAELGLQLTIKNIVNHQAICIELAKRSKVPIGCCYIPTDNIIDMINNNIKIKSFTMNLKRLFGNDEGNSKKLNVKCQIEITKLIDKTNKYEKIINKSVEVKQFKRKTNQSAEPISKPINVINSNKGKRQRNQTSDQLKTKHKMISVQSELNVNDKSKASYNNDASINMMKVQLQNKEIRFSIKEYKPNQSTNSTNCTYKFAITPEKRFNINQEVVIHSSEIKKKGITISVLKVQQHQEQFFEDNEGSFHLNVVVLFSRHIYGVFPVNNNENECVGLVILDNPSCQRKINKQQQQQQLGEKNTDTAKIYKEEQQSLQKNECTKIYMFQFIKLYILKQAEFLIYNKNDKISYVQTIIRIGTNLIKVYKACELKVLNILDREIVEVVFKQPILIQEKSEIYKNQLDNDEDKAIEIEIELYADIQLVGYAKIQHAQHRQFHCNKQTISYNSALLNMSTNGYICHAAINFISLAILTTYFPNEKLKQSVKCLMDWNVIGAIMNKIKKCGQLKRKEYEDEIRQYLMKQSSEIIFIQGQRIAQLILNSVFSETYCFIFPYKQDQSTTIIGKQHHKLLQQMLYLDTKNEGKVEINEMKSIAQYYGISLKLCQMGKERYIWNGKQRETHENKGDVLYLFAVVGKGFQMCTGFQLKEGGEPTKDNFNNLLLSQQPMREVEENVKHYNHQNEKAINNLSQHVHPQMYHIDAIACFEMHTLMHNNAIPSIRIKVLSSEYSTRPYYSSANPVIRINKKIWEGQTLIIAHHNIKFNQDIEIGRIAFKAGIMEYRLGRKASVKFVIGQDLNTNPQ